MTDEKPPVDTWLRIHDFLALHRRSCCPASAQGGQQDFLCRLERIGEEYAQLAIQQPGEPAQDERQHTRSMPLPDLTEGDQPYVTQIRALIIAARKDFCSQLDTSDKMDSMPRFKFEGNGDKTKELPDWARQTIRGFLNADADGITAIATKGWQEFKRRMLFLLPSLRLTADHLSCPADKDPFREQRT